jgi:hypothetical protein
MSARFVIHFRKLSHNMIYHHHTSRSRVLIVYNPFFIHFSTTVAHISSPFTQTPPPNNHSFTSPHMKSPSISTDGDLGPFAGGAENCLAVWTVVMMMIELKTYVVFQSTAASSLRRESKRCPQFTHCISVLFLLKKYRNFEGCLKAARCWLLNTQFNS